MPIGVPKYFGKIEESEELKNLFTILDNHYKYVDGELFSNIYYGKHCDWRHISGSISSKGYRVVHIYKFGNMLLHRVVFLMFHRYLPLYIDHSDRNKLNNKIENLRETTAQDNMLNRGIKSTNTSGVTGVWFRKGYWEAEATKNYKKYCIGRFLTKEEAHTAYLAKRKELDS